MSLPNLQNVLQWWVVFFFTGIIFYPLTRLLFDSFFDKGYIFAKILGILLISYASWLLSSLKILPFTTFSLIVIMAIFLIINTLISYKKQSFSLSKKTIEIFLIEEILFTIGLIFWSYVRAHEPSIHGLEKFMDFGFINSILRSKYFPPADLWMAPLSINYYYFGHLTTAILTKLSFLNPVITYNLMVATLFTLTLSASFSLAANFYHKFSQNLKLTILAGLIGAFLVTLGGNLHTIYMFFQTYTPESPVPFWQLPFSLNISGYWYPNATRFIIYTIHEFPIYSFVVSDLHGHVLNIPFILLLIAILIKIFYQKKLFIYDYLLLSLLIATSVMTNVLDGPIYLLGIFILIFALEIKKTALFKAFLISCQNMILITAGFIIFSLPYWLSFKPFASGIGVLCAPNFLTKMGRLGPLLFETNHCARSPFWMMAILWGFFFFVILSFIILVVRKNIKKLTQLEGSDYLVIILSIFATILIIIPEFVYVKDIYPTHYRANTLFKFGYQAFIIFGLVSGYMIIRILREKRRSIFYILFFSFLFFLVSIYPYFAINSYYGELKTYKGLDGFKYFEDLYPTDYQAILWINNNIKGQPIILEAQGDSYTDYARISSNTGLPTVIGWPVHEWLWRGSYDEAGKRSSEVTTLYESPDLNLTKQLLQKYNVSYVFIGALERQKYIRLDESKFEKLGKIIYQNGTTKIYQIIR